MRITVLHTKSKEAVIRSVDQSFDDLFRGVGSVPIQFVEERRSWQGSTLAFSISAKMGFVSSPIKGTIEVTDTISQLTLISAYSNAFFRQPKLGPLLPA